MSKTAEIPGGITIMFRTKCSLIPSQFNLIKNIYIRTSKPVRRFDVVFFGVLLCRNCGVYDFRFTAGIGDKM